MQRFINEVLTRFAEEITDQVFLFIQNDERGLLQKYLDSISEHGRQTVNAAIGEQINDYFSLKNKLDSNGNKIKGNPKSFLIKTGYTKHEK